MYHLYGVGSDFPLAVRLIPQNKVSVGAFSEMLPPPLRLSWDGAYHELGPAN